MAVDENQTADWNAASDMSSSSASLYGQRKAYTAPARREDSPPTKYLKEEFMAQKEKRGTGRGRPRSTPKGSVKYEYIEDFIVKAAEVSPACVWTKKKNSSWVSVCSVHANDEQQLVLT